MSKSISISNPSKVISLVLEPQGNGNKIGGNLDLSIFTNATNIDVSDLDIKDLGKLPLRLITFDASNNKIGNIDINHDFNAADSIRTFNLKTNNLSATDIDTILSRFNTGINVELGSLIDISGYGNSLVDTTNRATINDLINRNWTVNYNNYQYAMTSNQESVEEGKVLAVEINTTSYKVRNGELAPYTITGISQNDIVTPVPGNTDPSAPLTGNFRVVNQIGTINLNILKDTGIAEYQEVESVTVTLDPSLGNTSLTIPITDTTPPPFFLVADGGIAEGRSFNVTIGALNADIADGTVVPYTISGIDAYPITEDDIEESFTGSFVINNNTDTITINVKADNISEGDVNGTERLKIKLDDYPVEAIVNIFDTNYALKATQDDPTTVAFDHLSAVSGINETTNKSFNVVLKTEGLSSGTIPYVITGVSASDIDKPLTGEFNLDNNIASIAFNVTEDFTDEIGGETFTLTLGNGFSSVSVPIGDTSQAPTLDALTALDSNGNVIFNIDEGETVTVKVETTGIAEGESINFLISQQSIQADDFTSTGFDGGPAPSNLQGSFTIDANGEGTVDFTLKEDRITEGAQVIVVKMLPPFSGARTIQVNDTSQNPTFALSTTDATLNEPTGSNSPTSATITLTTQRVDAFTSVPYEITGIQPNDIDEDLTGNFTIDANGEATTTITIADDGNITEGTETLRLSLGNPANGEFIDIDIVDVNTNPNFALTNNATSGEINEGDSVTFTLTTNVPETYDYTISGDETNTTISSADFDSSGGETSLTGSFTVTGTTDTVTYKLKDDFLTEGSLLLTMTLDDSTTGPASASVLVNDTSVETFVLSTTATLVSGTPTVGEGGNVTIKLVTQGISDATLVPFTISGTDITTDDFVGLSSLTGNFNIINSQAEITFEISEDVLTEGGETFTLSLDNGVDTIDIAITDDSLTQTFALTSSPTSGSTVQENGSVTINLSTTNLSVGDQVPFTISGTNITTDDFVNLSSLSGNFVIGANGQDSSITLQLNEDNITEGSETFALSLDNGQGSISINVGDTSQESFALGAWLDGYGIDDPNDLTKPATVIYENNEFWVYLTTAGVPDNTSVPFTISGSGIDTDDFKGADQGHSLSNIYSTTSGSFTVVNNVGKKRFFTREDYTTENSTSAGSITVTNATNSTYNKTYTFDSASNSWKNGDDSFSIVSYGRYFDNGRWAFRSAAEYIESVDTLTGAYGNVDSIPFLSADWSGTIIDTENWSFTTSADFNEGYTETWTLTLDGKSISQSVEIADTSTDATFELTSNPSSVNETATDGLGSFFEVTLNTTNYASSRDGLVRYNITGTGVTANDFDELINPPEKVTNAKVYSSVYGHTGTYFNTYSGSGPNNDNSTTIPSDYALSQLDSSGSWQPATITDPNDYVSISTFNQLVTGLITQGSGAFNSFVKSYRVQYRDLLTHDGITHTDWEAAGNYENNGVINGQGWRWFDVDNGNVFTANTDRDTKVEVKFTNPVTATQIKIIPVTFHAWKAMRVAAVIPAKFTDNFFRHYKRANPYSAPRGTYGAYFLNSSSTDYYRLRPDLTSEGTETATFTITGPASATSYSTTVDIVDTSLNPSDQPLRLLQIGRDGSNRGPSEVFPPRNTDINEGFSTASYVYPPSRTLSTAPSLNRGAPFNQNSDYFDSIIDPTRTFTRYSGGYSGIPYSDSISSDIYNVLIFNNFSWSPHTDYHLRQRDDNGNAVSPTSFGYQVKPPGLMRPDDATMTLLKQHIINGGTIIEFTEHSSYLSYVYPPASFGYSYSSFISQIIYDLGGINGSNGGWKSRSIQASGTANPTDWALSNISANLTNQVRGYAGTIINNRSNGEAILSNEGSVSQSIVHIWDGNLGHLNNGVKGKIIFLGDSQLQGATSSQTNNFKNGLTVPLLEYISANRVT